MVAYIVLVTEDMLVVPLDGGRFGVLDGEDQVELCAFRGRVRGTVRGYPDGPKIVAREGDGPGRDGVVLNELVDRRHDPVDTAKFAAVGVLLVLSARGHTFALDMVFWAVHVHDDPCCGPVGIFVGPIGDASACTILDRLCQLLGIAVDLCGLEHPSGVGDRAQVSKERRGVGRQDGPWDNIVVALV